VRQSFDYPQSMWSTGKTQHIALSILQANFHGWITISNLVMHYKDNIQGRYKSLETAKISVKSKITLKILLCGDKSSQI